jgi:hypothetical protein
MTLEGDRVDGDGTGANLSLPLIALMRGIVHRDDDAALWQSLVDRQGRIRDYVAVLGLEPIIDEAEGYAFLRQRPPVEGDAELPRLVARRQLGYAVSLLLALLRKRLAEFDASGGETRLILSREDIFDMVRLFLPASGNEASADSSRITTLLIRIIIGDFRGDVVRSEKALRKPTDEVHPVDLQEVDEDGCVRHNNHGRHPPILRYSVQAASASSINASARRLRPVASSRSRPWEISPRRKASTANRTI